MKKKPGQQSNLIVFPATFFQMNKLFVLSIAANMLVLPKKKIGSFK